MRYLLPLILLLGNLWAAEPNFKTIEPVRPIKSDSILDDIYAYSRYTNLLNNKVEAGNKIGQPMYETDVHEGTHGLNSFVRNGSPKYNGFYVLKGRYIQFWEPKITFDDISKHIPLTFKARSKHDCYDRHFNAAYTKEWLNHPLYIIDEWLAYTHGNMYYDEVGELKQRSVAPTHLIDLTVFSFALLKALPEDYQYKQELTDFIVWNTKRIQKLVPKSEVMIERLSLFAHSSDCKELFEMSETLLGRGWNAK